MKKSKFSEEQMVVLKQEPVHRSRNGNGKSQRPSVAAAFGALILFVASY